jgi:hypothetical protein
MVGFSVVNLNLVSVLGKSAACAVPAAENQSALLSKSSPKACSLQASLRLRDLRPSERSGYAAMNFHP